jgi:hypothetical protein
MTDETTQPQANEPEGLGKLVRDHPGVVIAGGIAIGAIAAALLPRAAKSNIAKRTLAAAGDLVQEGASRLGDLGEAVGESTGEARRRATRAATSTGTAGLELAKSAVDLIASLRRR